MKNIPLFLLIVLLLSACGGETGKESETLAGKKELIKTKKAEIKTLQNEIDKLKEEVIVLDPASQVKTRRKVVTDTVVANDVERFVEMQAAVEADDASMASSETGGRITNVSVREGQAVRKGNLIATVDMESVNKQIAEVQTSLSLAADVFMRQSKLWEQNIGSEIQYLQAKNQKESLEKSLETLNFQLTKANVYAPISGVVDEVMSDAGEMASPGMPIVKIMNTYRVKVVASVPEKYLPVVKRGQKVTIKFPALNEERVATVTTVGRSINPANRTFGLEVILNNKNGNLKPNLLASMELKDFTAKNVVSIPLAAIQQEISGEDYVFVKGESAEGAIAKKAYVKKGERIENSVIITEGLKPGDQLVVEGARGLSEGELIEITTRKNDLTSAAESR